MGFFYHLNGWLGLDSQHCFLCEQEVCVLLYLMFNNAEHRHAAIWSSKNKMEERVCEPRHCLALCVCVCVCVCVQMGIHVSELS